MKRKASKQRTVYTLELSPKEWETLCRKLPERTAATSCECHSCDDARVLCRLRNRMAAADRARARKAGK